MIAGPGRAVVLLHDDSKNNVVNIRGVEIEIRSADQDKWQYLSCTADMIHASPIFLLKLGQALFADDIIVMDYWISKTGEHTIEIREGRQLIAIKPEMVRAIYRNGKIISLADNCFGETVKTEDRHRTASGIFFEAIDERVIRTKVISAGPAVKALGINEGDICIHYDDTDVPFRIGDKIYSSLQSRYVLAVERDGEIIPVNDAVLLVRDGWPEKVGSIFIPEEAQSKQDTAEVLRAGSTSGFVPGDGCCFNRGELTLRLKHNGQFLMLTKKEHLFLRYERS